MQRHQIDLPTPRRGPTGPLGEQLAVTHLEDDDRLDVVVRNWSRRHGDVRGELDVVAVDHDRGLVVVVEVKARRSLRQGGPLVAVTPRKQARIRSLTALFLRDEDLPCRRVRFDVVGLLLPPSGPGRLTHVPGAF